MNERPYSEILDWLNYLEQSNNVERWWFMQHLLQTANGRYMFGNSNANFVPSFQFTGFREWLRGVWGTAQ